MRLAPAIPRREHRLQGSSLPDSRDRQGASLSRGPLPGGRGYAEPPVLGANDLFQQGKFEEAQQKLQAAQQALTAASAKARRGPAPAGRAASLDKDFEVQAGALSAASEGLRKDKAAPDTDRSLRRNQEVANPFMK